MRAERLRLPTWGKKTAFEYSGSISTGTRLYFGEDFKREAFVPGEIYLDLLRVFSGRRVPAGTSHKDPPEGSLGEWLLGNVTKQALASYVAAILVHEEYAKKDQHEIIFK